MSTIRKKLLPEVLVPLLLTLGAALPLFYQIVVLAPQQPDNVATFYSFSSGLDHYFELKTAWKTRLFSNALAWQVDRAAADLMSRVDVQYINRPQPFALGLWTSGWFVAIGLVYILFLKRRAVLYILGTYAALTFGYMPKLPATRVLPVGHAGPLHIYAVSVPLPEEPLQMDCDFVAAGRGLQGDGRRPLHCVPARARALETGQVAHVPGVTPALRAGQAGDRPVHRARPRPCLQWKPGWAGRFRPVTCCRT